MSPLWRHLIILFLIETRTFWWVKLSKNIKFIHSSEYNKNNIPKHQDGAVTFIQLPTIQMCGDHQKNNSWKKRKSWISQTWRYFKDEKGKDNIFTTYLYWWRLRVNQDWWWPFGWTKEDQDILKYRRHSTLLHWKLPCLHT